MMRGSALAVLTCASEMDGTMTDEPPATDRLDQLLGRIGSELDRLAKRLSEIGVAEDAPSDASGPLPTSQVIALQSVDQAEQTLRELALVLRRTAASDLTAARIDLAGLAKNLSLAHTASVILGVHVEPEDEGELDLF